MWWTKKFDENNAKINYSKMLDMKCTYIVWKIFYSLSHQILKMFSFVYFIFILSSECFERREKYLPFSALLSTPRLYCFNRISVYQCSFINEAKLCSVQHCLNPSSADFYCVSPPATKMDDTLNIYCN